MTSLLDVVVNNAGTIHVGPATAMAQADFEKALGATLWTAVHTTLAALPTLHRQGHGTLVNITSIGGVLPAPHLLPYTTAEHAAVGISEGLDVELRREGIRTAPAVAR